ncbi:hypothetical protein NWFMUON74_23710 [Nocardia wallacei]|uniref:Uncharacterized protein n=2 Tax=Nocardia wallacei TaxID=480035 RepID=A0A7G1KKU7_9NOCA|nr:hypothetical protein NWFMUON74_23710 [Nocardia wallacei]
MWVRALRVVSVLLGIAALLRTQVRALGAGVSAALRRPLARLRGDVGRQRFAGSA